MGPILLAISGHLVSLECRISCRRGIKRAEMALKWVPCGGVKKDILDFENGISRFS